ncbi:MAG: site-specific tyrosine recombinase XerD [Acidipropionibacterium jensenii]|uniref:site-specific tyrosine recombinase XerD n=1 Tax=Acidipropionibacterium jensenii TaxID=1749 RepID=UPI002649F02C|nr:site-specific tyrosine recombinase XerD [Acidipropionibacterium jensenii]MDN6441838.1 site-specific tyrosine recombinase XerD [Acidipropionibacterium jensenii]
MSDASVDDLVVDYLSHLAVERGLSDNTVAAYRRDLDRYRHFLAGRGLTDLAQVSAVDVSEFSRDLARRDLAPASVSRAVVAVRNLHAFALAEGRVGLDVAHEVSPGARPRRLPKALSIESVEALLDSCDTTTVEGLRDRALLELLYGTGARVSEVCSLDVDDLTPVLSDPQQGLRLFGKGGRERVVPLGSYAADAVRGWLVRGRRGWAASHGSGSAPATPALLLNQRGGRLSRQSAWAVIQRAGQRAGITEHLSPHSLRHSFATHLLDGGADVRVVQELLGHASVTTPQIYTLVTVEHLREVYRSSHPRALSSDERDGPTTPVGTTD